MRPGECGLLLSRVHGFWLREAVLGGDISASEPASARKCGDDLLDHAVGKIQYSCSGSIAAHMATAVDGLLGRYTTSAADWRGREPDRPNSKSC